MGFSVRRGQQVQREAWATDLDLPAFAVTAEQVLHDTLTFVASQCRAATQITVWPDYFVDDRDHSSFGKF